ncbi:MAG: prepilin-type N-terminal cleavage/methylation domain-containing protein [Bdellovibrionota bacterium]|nr:prepilin-type N-terminal cleavage/methylation domain-containing protein [Bdellovibrionota bacterium]
MKNLFSLTQDGFSLVELLVAVAIIGVLSSLAIPSYEEFVYRTRVKLTISQLISHANGIIALRVVEDKTATEISGSLCSRCSIAVAGDYAYNFNWPNLLAQQRYRSLGFEGVPSDAWGSYLLLDENEGEWSDCRGDAITSVGRDFLFSASSATDAQGDDIRIWIPRYRKSSVCNDTRWVQLGPDVFN